MNSDRSHFLVRRARYWARLSLPLILPLSAACSSSTSPTNSKDASPEASTGGSGGSGGSMNVPDSGPSKKDSGADSGAHPQVTTKSGAVIGKTDNGTSAFLGIPYAAPPTGDNRWRAPQPVAPWTTPLDATKASKVCPQIQAAGTTIDPRSDENCLYLNVWTPDVSPAKPLPVMFFIHGGAFVFGSGIETYYDGSKIAMAGDVVVVTINYRLGALGFLALPQLTSESADHPTSGDYGIEDQQVALGWVKDNIAAFGGDPAHVTIFGESAGGLSTCAHLIAPKSAGLFVGAISESGLCSGLLTETIADAYSSGDALAKTLGCAAGSGLLTCLRGKTPTDLVNAFPDKTATGGLFFQRRVGSGDAGSGADAGPADGNPWGPVVDGDVIPVPIAQTGPGFAKVPLMLGTNANEYALFTNSTFGGNPITTRAEFESLAASLFGPARAAEIVAQYPASTFPNANDALVQATTDAGFACPARRLARDASAFGSNVYLYAFAHVPEKPLVPGLGSFHSSELAYVFGFASPLTTTQADEEPLVTAMQGYWTRFAATGDPNGSGTPSWPKYTTSGDQNISLNLPAPTTQTGYRKSACDFWDSLSVYRDN